jgi:hypothetical protein
MFREPHFQPWIDALKFLSDTAGVRVDNDHAAIPGPSNLIYMRCLKDHA